MDRLSDEEVITLHLGIKFVCVDLLQGGHVPAQLTDSVNFNTLNCAVGLTASQISHKAQRKRMSREIEKDVCSTAHTEVVTFEMKPKHVAV